MERPLTWLSLEQQGAPAIHPNFWGRKSIPVVVGLTTSKWENFDSNEAKISISQGLTEQ